MGIHQPHRGLQQWIHPFSHQRPKSNIEHRGWSVFLYLRICRAISPHYDTSDSNELIIFLWKFSFQEEDKIDHSLQ